MKILNLILITLTTLFFIVACNDDNDISISTVKVDLEQPASLTGKQAVYNNLVVTFENVNTGAVSTHDANSLSLSNLMIEDGLYSMKAAGDVTYKTSYKKSVKKDNGEQEQQLVIESVTNKLRGYSENVEVRGGQLSLKLKLFLYKENVGTGFVLSEIFFTRTTTPDGNPYVNDAFIEIYNNSNETLYADGLCVAETFLETVNALNEMKPDFRSNKIAIKDVYRIPGNGKEHPVKPGETLLLCDIAINHKVHNSNSFDLSKANFEWFDGAEVDDVDIPEVPNLEKMISTNGGTWNPNTDGNTSYVLFQLGSGVSPETFLKNNALSFTHLFVFGSYKQEMPQETWSVANDKVIDAVQIGVPGEFKWTIFSPELDLSWTYATETRGYNGLSVKRKVSYKDGKRIVLQDTNDSATDFIPTAIPSPGVIEAN